MSLTQREAFARLFTHMCEHDGDGGHGYSQYHRDGVGSETVDLGDGVCVTIAGGDRDCSSGIISALQAVGIDTYGATYTGNMRGELLKTGLFVWHDQGDGYSAQRGDIYLNKTHHTAMCTSADPDMLAQFSISEKGTIDGQTGDQTGKESNIRAYYSYPWDGKLAWVSDGATIEGCGEAVDSGGSGSSSDDDYWWWGPQTTKRCQEQRGTTVDGIVSDQPSANREHVPAADPDSWDWVADPSGGSELVMSLQRMTGASVDGWFGPQSATSLQQWLIDHGYDVGDCGADGYFGSDSVRGLCAALDDGALRC